MAVRRETFLASGGFDDDYFAYLEDVDFGWRQWIFGNRVVAEPRAVARHRGGATAEALGVFSRGFLYEKNAFATAFKNFDREHFRALMPAILAAFLGRVAEMLATRNPGARELERDPYAPASARRRTLAALFGISLPETPAVRLEDPLTVAHLRALLWIRRHRDALAAKRRAVQARRRRTDAEIFASFPLRLVPTYPGDGQFDSEFFGEFLADAPGTRARRRSPRSSRRARDARLLRRHPDLPAARRPSFRVLDALAAQAGAAGVRGRRGGRRIPRRDARAARGATRRGIPFASSRAGKRGARGGAQPRRSREAPGTLILFLGDDTVPEPNLLAVHARAHAEPRRRSGRRARLHDLAERAARLAVSPPHQRVRPAVRLRPDRGSRVACRSISSTRRTSRCRGRCCSRSGSSTRRFRTRPGRTSRSPTG